MDIVRCSDDSYWIHVRVNKEGDGTSLPEETQLGTLVAARVDVLGMHASETINRAVPFQDERTYHVAVKLAKANP